MINLSKDFLQRTIVPPKALDFLKAKLLSSFSSEFKSQKYSPLKGDMQKARSALNICGSDRNIRSGPVKSVKFLREYIFLFRPSMFQHSDDIDK